MTGFFLLRWRSARQDAQRLYYRAAVWGGILAATAASAHLALLVWPTYRDLFGWLHTTFLQPLLTSKDPPPAPSLIIRAHVAWVCVCALLLGLGLPALGRAGLWVTRLLGMRLEVQLNLQTITDPLESLLSRSLLKGEAVQATLSTGKVYVGYVLEALDPDLPTKFIKLQPLMSGQRGSDGNVEYTTFYDKVLADFAADPATKAAVDSFQQVIPVDKVVTLSGFNLDAYVHFLAEREGQAGSPAQDVPPAPPKAPVAWFLLAGVLLGRFVR